MKEAEWNTEGTEAPTSSTNTQSVQVHWQRLSMITQQLQEKRRFAAELTQKTRELEDQLARQRALIDELGRSSSCSGDDGGNTQALEAARASTGRGENLGLRLSVAL